MAPLADRLLARLVNPVVLRVLRSPVHDLLSRHVALLELTGRRSGRTVRVPVDDTAATVAALSGLAIARLCARVPAGTAVASRAPRRTSA